MLGDGGGVGHTVGLNRLDAHFGKVLPVSLQLLVLLLPLQVKDKDLFSSSLAQHFGDHLGGGWLGHGSRLTGNGQNVAELDKTGVRSHTFNLYNVARRDPILLPPVRITAYINPPAQVRLSRCAPKINGSGGNFRAARTRSSSQVKNWRANV